MPQQTPPDAGYGEPAAPQIPVGRRAPRAPQRATFAQPAVSEPDPMVEPPSYGYEDRPGAFRYGGNAPDDPYTDELGDGPIDELDDVDDEELQRRGGCRQRLGMMLLVVAAVMCLLLVAAGVWVRSRINPSGPPGERVTVEISRGQSTSEIGDTLEQAGVITDSTVWTWYVRFRGGGDIQAGSYQMRRNLSMGDALDILTDGPSTAAPGRVTVPEGFNVDQTIARLADPEDGVPGFTEETLRAAMQDPSLRSPILPADQTSLEGILFPETYDITENIDELGLLQRMVQQFDRVAQEVGLEEGAAAVNRSPYEVLIIASMIEEEARVAEERPKVARVIYNRLNQDWALGIDATTCYGTGRCPPTSADLEDASSPYNTSRRKGLPVTPITNPSRASIEAALHPADGPWMFYVLADEEGHHEFVVTEEEFTQAKQRCQERGLCG